MKKRFAKTEQSFVGKIYTLSQHQVVVEETIAEGRYLTYSVSYILGILHLRYLK